MKKEGEKSTFILRILPKKNQTLFHSKLTSIISFCRLNTFY